MALHTVLFREQALKWPLIGLALLVYAALVSSTLGRVEVSLLAWLAEDAASSGAGNERVFVHARTLSLAFCLLLTTSKAGTSSPAAQI